METRGVPLILVTHLVNVRYLTGFTGSAGIAYTATTLPPGILNSGNCTINTNDCTFTVDPAHFAGTAAGTTAALDVQLTVTGVTPVTVN